MKHHITYEVNINGILYKNLTEEFRSEIIDFYFEVFLKDEPTTVSAGGYTDRHPEIIKQVQEIIDDGVSLIAVDPNNSKLVGMMLCHIVEKSKIEPRGTYEDFLKTYPPLHASIMSLFDEIMYPGDLFESYPEDNKFYDMFTLATHPGYRGRGIGKNLVIESLKLAKQVNCSAAIVLATNDFSRMIFNKIGMKIIATKNWEDCIHNGKQDFGKVPSEMASSHYLKL